MEGVMSIITINNEELTVSISSLGAEILSVKNKDGREYMWKADPKIWGNRALVLFPIVSRLKNGKYTYNGKEYSMDIHGFARVSEFEVEESNDLSVTFLLTSNDQTRAVYPFDFEFRVSYTLKGRQLLVDFKTNNKTDGNMYYSVGSHEGYATVGDISNYSIVLDEEETLSRYEVVPEGYICETPSPCFEASRELKLDERYFEVDGIIFLDIKNRGVSLRDDRTGESIHVDFPGFDTLLIWKKPNAEYVCIEPWAGAPELPWIQYNDFSDKYRIRTLKKGESEVLTHIITF
jgi:galactose mutarotase-like enzyme